MPQVESKVQYHEHNSPPAGLREITEKEFAQSLFFSCDPVRTEYRQVLPQAMCDFTIAMPTVGNPPRSVMMPLRLYWFHNLTGIAITADFWAGKVRYFWFGACDHSSSAGRTLGNCYHEYTCTACGYKWVVDTSD